MENNTNTMMTATQPSFVAPSFAAAVRLREAATTHGAANAAAAVWTDAAVMVVKVRRCVVAIMRAIPGPVVWSPPAC
ncbi:hypothetical protein [Nocardioides gilvus]|uniref:hypothetical protein n=1 Tax=Nocardioides gilvus TaxID=1735589 RepID=UPI000D750D02|nr:hypothetical protein [Nocardioides gilvus]